MTTCRFQVCRAMWLGNVTNLKPCLGKLGIGFEYCAVVFLIGLLCSLSCIRLAEQTCHLTH